MRDKSPRNAPQNILLLKRILENICPPTEYKPMYPDGRGKIDEPLLVYKGSRMANDDSNVDDKRAAPKSRSLTSQSVCASIYATSSSSSSDGDCEPTSKEHSLNSLYFTDFAEDLYELVDGDVISPWSNPNE